jgi:hypothetical protein
MIIPSPSNSPIIFSSEERDYDLLVHDIVNELAKGKILVMRWTRYPENVVKRVVEDFKRAGWNNSHMIKDESSTMSYGVWIRQ